MLLPRLVRPRHASEADRDAVPGIDRGHCPGHVYQFFLGELLPRLLVEIVGHTAPDESDGVRPGQSRTLTIVEERCFAPGVERVDSLLRFAGSAGILGMHVDAEGASVDLRGPDLD